MATVNSAPELEQLLHHSYSEGSDEPIVVNPPPPTGKDKKQSQFAPNSYQRIFNESKYHRLTVEHINPQKWSYYKADIFHTLINMKSYRFLIFFIACYLAMYSFFALLYRSQGEHCIFNVHNFFHALWFSVITAATIGYGHQAPDPDCYLTNTIVMCQVLTSVLMQAALLGLVYSRFAAPGSRAHTIKFSSILTCYRAPDGYWRLAFRVANLRRHQVLQPEVQLLMLLREHVDGPDGPLEYRYHELPLMHISGQKRLWLGVPSIVAHRIDEASDLWEMWKNCGGGNGGEYNDMNSGASGVLFKRALEGMEGLEFVALLDGIDETTSTVMQARHSYGPHDIRYGESFAGLLARGENGALEADFTNFDLTRSDQHSVRRQQREQQTTVVVGVAGEEQECVSGDNVV